MTETIITLFTPDDDPEVNYHVNAAIKVALLHKRMHDKTPAERQTEIQRVQDTIGALKMQYSDDTLEFIALQCAYESLRFAWRSVGGDIGGAEEKLERLHGDTGHAMEWLTVYHGTREFGEVA